MRRMVFEGYTEEVAFTRDGGKDLVKPLARFI
jgi:hypothetical protein